MLAQRPSRACTDRDVDLSIPADPGRGHGVTHCAVCEESMGNADMSLGAYEHVSRKTSLYDAMVYMRRWLHHTGDSAVNAGCISSHISHFFDPDANNRVLAGCAFRIRYGVNAAAAVAEFDYLQVESVWSELDPEAFAPDAYESARSPARRSSRAKAASKKPASKKPTVKKLKAKK